MSTKIGKFDDLTPEQNEKLDNLLISDEELKELDRSTRPDIENDDDKYTNGDYSEEELKQLYDDFAGYKNDDVRYEYAKPTSESNGNVSIKGEDYKDIIDKNGDIKEYGELYKQTGLHRVTWSDDAKGKKEKIIIPAGTVLQQYSHKDSSGTYFEPQGTEYRDLQLADSEDKRILSTYEVVEDFEVLKSEIAMQYFNANSPESFDNAIQYQSSVAADELVKAGILKKKSL